MKWFEKHTTDRNDLASKLIKRKFGLAGYGIYESLQQIVAENMDGDDVNEWGLVAKNWTMETLAEEIGCSVDEFRQFVTFCDDQLILEKKNGRLFMPLLLERMNEYAKRQYRKNEKKLKKEVSTDTTECTDSPNTTDKPASQHITSQHNTTQSINTGDKRPEKTMGAMLKDRLAAIPEPQKGITKAFQDKAFRYAKDLAIPMTEGLKPRWLKMFKDAENGRKSGNLERAYSYLRDYPVVLDDESKVKMFFSIYENGLKNYS